MLLQVIAKTDYLNRVSSKLIKLLICCQLTEKHDTEKFLKFCIATDAFSCIITGLKSAILHLKIQIRDDCLTDSS